MDKFYSVEELAQACGVTPRAVRLYIEKGLLTPKRAGRSFVFTDKSPDRLETILRAKRLGLSLEEIGARLAPSPDILEAMINRVKTVKQDAADELVHLRRDLDESRRRQKRKRS